MNQTHGPLPIDATLLASAIVWAVTSHGTDLNKDGTPYITHPLRMMMAATTDAEKIVAVLHDAIEDTPLELGTLTHAGFPAEITNALDCLTKRDGEEYEDFIRRTSTNPLAARVKLLDLYDNIDVTRLPELGDWELARTAKYHRAIQYLTKYASTTLLPLTELTEIKSGPSLPGIPELKGL